MVNNRPVPLATDATPVSQARVSLAEHRTLRREIISLAWPAILEFSLHTVVWLTDVAFVGRLGPEALSATGLGGQVYSLVLFLFEAAAVAATAMVSRRVGAGDHQGAGRIAAQAGGVGLLLGCLTALVIWSAAPTVYSLTRLGPQVAALGVTYQRIIAFGAPAFLFRSALAGSIRGFGDTRSSMAVSVVAGLFNILGDWVLVFGKLGFPELGVAGAALASAMSHLLGAALLVVIVMMHLSPARIDLRGIFRFDRAAMRTMLRLALPAAGEHLFTDVARTVGVFAVAHLGAMAMAAHEVTAAAEALSFMPGFGFAMATSVIVGQNLGRGRPDLSRAAVGEGLRIAVLFGATMACVFLAFPGSLVGVFTTDTGVAGVAARLLRIAAIAQPFIAMQGIFGGALRGAGDTRSPLVASGVTSWAVRVALTYLTVVFLGLPVDWVWWAMTVDWAAKSLWMWILYRQGRWQRVSV